LQPTKTPQIGVDFRYHYRLMSVLESGESAMFDTTKVVSKDSERWGFARPIATVTVTLEIAPTQRTTKKEMDLQRLFSTFPSGWPGVGLFLLRTAIGGTALIQGGVYLTDHVTQGFEPWVVGLAMAVGGIALIIGFLTPVASILVALGTLGIALLWFPAPTPNLFNTPLPAILVVIVAAAIAFLGPGTASVDRRLFGRREIIIPHTTRQPGS
jgi:uncharacterized membrane protein YphA (DoxX/SURF4 family)